MKYKFSKEDRDRIEKARNRFQKIEILYSFVDANEFSPEYSTYSKK